MTLPQPKSSSSRSALFFLVGGAVLILFVILMMNLFNQPQPDYIYGDVQAREIKVASKIAGRIDAVLVQEGQQVKQGDVLFYIDSPELQAKLAQAQAAEDATRAQQDEAVAGLRTEEVTIAQLNWQRAQVAANVAKQTLDRLTQLHKEGLISQQQMDEAQAQADASRDQAQMAEMQFTMATQGAREEQLRALKAQNDRALAAVMEVESYQQETRMRAPIDGEVASLVLYPGELAATGYPVLTLVDLSDLWVTFYVREDKLKHLSIGTQVTAWLPALDQQAELQIVHIKALPSFADWKQAKGTPGFDIKTMQVKARFTTAQPQLRAGMSVILDASHW